MREEYLEELERLHQENGRLQWRFDHARAQYYEFLRLALPLLEEAQKRNIFIELGRKCAKSLGWGSRFKGDLEGFFEFMRQHNGETIRISEDRKIIRIETVERPCDCPIMKNRCVEGSYCNCSIGWQMEIYETILGQKVTVEVKEAAFRGSERCVFEVKL